jgi:hypothetical protein
MSESEEGSPRWLSVLLVLVALVGGLGFAIYRYVEYERSKNEPESSTPADSHAPKGAPAPSPPPVNQGKASIE